MLGLAIMGQIRGLSPRSEETWPIISRVLDPSKIRGSFRKEIIIIAATY